MPIYEFTCQNEECKHTSEKLIPMDTEHITCSKCGGDSVKIVSLPSDPAFKGAGWTPRTSPKMGGSGKAFR